MKQRPTLFISAELQQRYIPINSRINEIMERIAFKKITGEYGKRESRLFIKK